MARLLILDTEAVNALAHPRDRGATRLRAAAITSRARQDTATIAIPLPVLAETYRGDPSHAAINRLVNLVQVAPLTLSIARLAGQLRTAAGQGSGVGDQRASVRLLQPNRCRQPDHARTEHRWPFEGSVGRCAGDTSARGVLQAAPR